MSDLPMFMGWCDVERVTGSDRRCIKPMIDTGDFPRPVQFTPHREKFVTDEVIAWVHDRITNHRVAANG